MKSLSALLPGLVALCLLTACAGPQRTMPPAVLQSGAAAASAPATLGVTTGDVESGRNAKILYYHLMPLRAQHRGGADGSGVRKKYPADLVRRKGAVMKTCGLVQHLRQLQGRRRELLGRSRRIPKEPDRQQLCRPAHAVHPHVARRLHFRRLVLAEVQDVHEPTLPKRPACHRARRADEKRQEGRLHQHVPRLSS